MIVVIDYKAGNLYNVGNALHHLGVPYIFSGDPSKVAEASKIILPGVGSAAAAMDSLCERGLLEVLKNAQVPLLGICLGLQLLFGSSQEEDTSCLDILPGRVKRFDSSREKVPHIGWNQVELWSPSRTGTPLFDGIRDGAYFYFVHSYYAPVDERLVLGVTDYDGPFASAVRRKHFYGVQFHPERSGEAGLRLLRNFADATT